MKTKVYTVVEFMASVRYDNAYDFVVDQMEGAHILTTLEHEDAAQRVRFWEGLNHSQHEGDSTQKTIATFEAEIEIPDPDIDYLIREAKLEVLRELEEKLIALRDELDDTNEYDAILKSIGAYKSAEIVQSEITKLEEQSN